MKLGEIVKRINGRLLCGNMEYECTTFSKDTRNILLGDTYIGIKGGNFDGSLFWKEALDKGASTAIVSNETNIDISLAEGKNIVIVDDTLEALYEIAKYKRSLYDIPVIAITGSVGKTSTKDIIANVIRKKYTVCKTEGNYNNNIGLPFTILGLKDEEVLVLEMGMNHFGEIKLLSEIAKPTISVIVNVGSAHIGNLGSRENILKAKLEILDGMDIKKIVVNNDNDLLSNWASKANDAEVFTFGINNVSDVMASNVENFSEGSKFENDFCKNVEVPVAGEHFVLNSLASIAVGKELGLSGQEIASGIASFELTGKRMDIEDVEGIKVINDAYNASFESVVAAFGILEKYNTGRKIAVIGDIFELGEHSKQIHMDIGAEYQKRKIDLLLCAGENSVNICNQVSGKAYQLEKKEIVPKLLEMLEQGDVVLFKASNGMKFFELAEELKERLKSK